MTDPTGYRTIVVGTDGSELAAPTVARAALAAQREGAELVIVCAWSPLTQRIEAINASVAGSDTSEVVRGRDAASDALTAAVAYAAEQGATVGAALLVEGEAAAALLETARERQADLIVMGAAHTLSLAQRLLGTVASDVVQKATCDVLIVRPTREQAEFERPESD